MKNLLKILFVSLLFTSVLISCDKKDEEEEETGPVFSALTVEENKANLEDAGIEMLNEAKDLENVEAVSTTGSFVHFTEESDPFAGNGDITKASTIVEQVMRTVLAVSNISDGGIDGIYKSLKSTTEDPETIQEAYDMLTGIYAWNHSTYVWDFTKTGDEIRFEFPSTELGTTNNALFRIYGYTGYTGSNPYSNDLDYTGDLPQTIYAESKVDNVANLSYSFEATYNSSGELVDVETSLTIDTFVLTASASNTANTAASVAYSLTHDGNILLALSLDAGGDWSDSNIENNTTTEYDYYTWEEWVWNEETQSYDIIEVTDTSEWTEIRGHKIVKEGNASFQLLDIKIVGDINIEGLGDALETIDETYDWDTQEEEAINAGVVAINEQVDLSVRYADSDEIIAVAEAYPILDEYTWEWEEWVWNEATQDYDIILHTETESNWEIFFRFIFADGSLVDAETYFETGFEDLERQLEDWITALEDEWDF